MTSSNAGWYPDPQDLRLMRWWDGTSWTDDVYERTEPPGGPLDQRTPFPEAASSPTASSQAPAATGPGPRPPVDPYLPGPGGQAPPSGWAYPSAPATSALAERALPTTPDGVPLASWGRRAFARIIDGIVVTVVALALTFPTVAEAFRRAWDDAERAAQTGQSAAPMFTDPAMLEHLALVTFVQLLVGLAYEAVFLLWRAATPGKLALGLRVRRWDAGQRLTPTVVVRRWLAYQGAQALPYIGTPYGIIDLLWPVRDSRRQALHDKFARTCVVSARR